ncbi:hypothetical protein Pmani_036958 [Petrolisthes manimaculis]|uniref:Uncharacterized protein n=1 Tax=Petrolisthes manimaculis TaxID=1843537 RepID=A0AAE1NIP9_9EUCA|nr:hypothetical protein Pmani_036958 [Petrolisthes manimaculis]
MSKENITTEEQNVAAASEAGDKYKGEEEEEDGFDELLSVVGFGRWQIRPTLTVVLVALILPVHLVGMSLINAPMDFACFHSPDQTFPLAATTTNLTKAAASLDINETIHDLEHNRDLDYNRVRQVVFAIYKVTNNTYYTQTCQNASTLQYGMKARVVMAGYIDDENALDEEEEDDLPDGRYATGLRSCPYVEYDTSVFTSTVFSEGRGAEAEEIMSEAVRLNKAKLTTPLHDIVNTILKTNGSTKKDETNDDTTTTTTTTTTRTKVEGNRCVRLAEGVKAMWLYLTTPAMLIILLSTPVIWFLHSFVYLGVIVNANNFTSTIPSLYVALTGAMDWLAILVTTPLTHYLGRRVLVGGGLFFSGVLLLLNLAVPEDIVWLKWIVVMTGILNECWIISSELRVRP